MYPHYPEDTGLSRKQQDKLAGGLLDQVSYVFIFAPIAGGLAYVATLLSALGHFFKTSCFVFFGEGNVAAFACTTFAGLAGLAAFSVVLAFLVFANANLQHAALHLHVLAVALTLAGGILLFTAFLLSLILFNLSYSSGVLEAGDLDPNQEAQSEQTETDFWTDGERAERNEQLLRVQEQAEKNTLKSIKENDLKQMNAFLSRGQPTPTFEAAFDHPQTPRLKKKTPSTTTGKSNKYSNSWNRPTSRFDDAPLPPLPTPRSGRTSRRDTLPDTDDEQEMLDSVKPLDAFYKAKAPRRGFEPPPYVPTGFILVRQTRISLTINASPYSPAPTSSRYSQNTGYLQSVAPTASDLSQMPSAAEAREKANAVFEKQKQKHQSVAPSSVYSQM